jgi:general secretion pathway protein E/type IV pilus assembly protein PilB
VSVDFQPSNPPAGRRLSEAAVLQECGRLLVARRVLTRNQLEDAAGRARLLGQALDEVLLAEDLVKEDALLPLLSEISGHPVRPMASFEVPRSAVFRLPAATALQYRIVPVAADADGITIAAGRVHDHALTENLRTLLQTRVRWVLCRRREIEETLKHFHGIGADLVRDMGPAIRPPADAAGEGTPEAGNPGVARLVNEIIREAIQRQASDIHLEPMEGRVVLRYRVDGVLLDVPLPEGAARFYRGAVSAIKVMAQLNITERRLPQDGRLRATVEGEGFDLRVSVLPTQFGEAVNLRILNRKTTFLGLRELGLPADQLPVMRDLMSRSHGIVLITGPTGAGKTTTLYAALATIKSDAISIVTIEDPVEYQIDGILQIQVNTEIGLDFAAGLRSVLRHDPNVILIGEIRDRETADIAIKSSLTGHLVFSTLHTNDSPSAIARLVDMGIEPFLVASSVQGIVAQRLVRRVCARCREPAPVPESVRAEIEQALEGRQAAREFVRGRGCPDCKFTGYKGRSGLYEILAVDEPVRSLIARRASSDELQRLATRRGMVTLRRHGWAAAAAGLTTVEEVLRVTQAEGAGA